MVQPLVKDGLKVNDRIDEGGDFFGLPDDLQYFNSDHIFSPNESQVIVSPKMKNASNPTNYTNFTHPLSGCHFV